MDNMNNMNNIYQNGGLFLIKNSMNEKNSGFYPIIEMILDNESIFSILTYSSLSGFIFTLTIPENKSRYKDQHNNIITSLLLKIVFIEDDESSFVYIDNDDKKNIKVTETKQSFIKETLIQSDIWFESINYKQEISPSVANLSIFDEISSITLLNKMIEKANNDINTNNILIFLKKVIINRKNVSKGIGLLTMKNYENTTTYYNFTSSFNPYDPMKYSTFRTVSKHLLIKLIRLADIGYIHLDLHDSNILVINNNNCLIIDFGRVGKITDEIRGEINGLKNNIKIYKEIKLKKNRSSIIKSCKNIINYIREIDKEYQLENFNAKDGQMNWIKKINRNIIYDDEFVTMLINEFEPENINKHELEYRNILKLQMNENIKSQTVSINENKLQSYLRLIEPNKNNAYNNRINNFLRLFNNTRKHKTTNWRKTQKMK